LVTLHTPRKQEGERVRRRTEKLLGGEQTAGKEKKVRGKNQKQKLFFQKKEKKNRRRECRKMIKEPKISGRQDITKREKIMGKKLCGSEPTRQGRGG